MKKLKETFKVGQIVRYDIGPTALLEITNVSNPHGNDVRYYGRTWFGSAMGVYQADARKATKDELAKWKKEH